MATTELDLSWSDLRRGVSAICEQRGWHHGVPMMSSTDSSRNLVLARGCPLADQYGHDVPINPGGAPQVHVCRSSDIDDDGEGPYVTNAWDMSHKMVIAYMQKGKAKVRMEDRSRDRFEMYVRSLLCQAGAVDSDTELKAMLALRKRINDNQWDAYILGNAFPETSIRSGVTYIFRKGLPTIAMRCVKRPEGGEMSAGQSFFQNHWKQSGVRSLQRSENPPGRE